MPLSQANFTQVEQARWQHFGQLSSTQSIRLVEIGSLPDLIENGQLVFSVPGGPQNLQAKAEYVREETNGDYVWWATLADETGYVGVAKNDTAQFVYIQKDSQFYQIYPLSERYGALAKTTPAIVSRPPCLSEEDLPDDITTDPNNCTLISDCKATVSVLVLVTPEAQEFLSFEWHGLYLWLGLHSTNFALLNSGLFGKTFRFVVEPYDFEFTESSFILDDLVQLRDDQDAQARRAANRADLMVLLTGQRYENALGAWYSTHSALGWFGIVSVEHLVGVRNLFAHEVGHSFGLNHNRVSNGGDVPYEGTDVCNFGWRFLDQDNIERRTIMAPIPDSDVLEGESQILNYSNPDVIFNGTPTGNQHNANANRLSWKMCEVDDYFEDEELEVTINGPDFICDELATYTAEITNEPQPGQPGSGPYTFQWWKNDNGFFNILNGSNPPGTPMGNTQTIQFYSPPDQTFWLAVFVCGSDNVCANHVLKVESPCGEFARKAGKQTPNLPQSFSLHPNPTYDFVRLQFETNMNGAFEYILTNSIGQIVANDILEAEKTDGFDINLPNILPSGMYQLSLRNETFFAVKTLSVNR